MPLDALFLNPSTAASSPPRVPAMASLSTKPGTTSPQLRPRGPNRPPSLPNIQTALAAAATTPTTGSAKRPRSSSIVSVQEIKADYDEVLDQEAMNNINADWVNYKGAWLIHVVLIVLGKVIVDIIPGMSQDLSWTLVLQGYMMVSYLMFHYVTGTPFEAHGGVFDSLTLWEQIDHGAQYTPAKKWLTSTPIVLFLLSTHYTRYDRHPKLFSLNFCSLLFLGLAPKLPQMHRLRIRFFEPNPPRRVGSQSGDATPIGGLKRDGGRTGPPTPIAEGDEVESPAVQARFPAFVTTAPSASSSQR